MYANVIVDADVPGISQSYTYRIPSELDGRIQVGDCVAIPFGGRDMVGYVLELSDRPPVGVDGIKDIQDAIPDACSLTPPLIDLALWISDHYAAPLAHSFRAILPEVMSAQVNSTIRLLDPTRVHAASPAQRKLVKLLEELGGECDSDTLKCRSRIEKFGQVVKQLRNRAAIDVVRVLELPKARALTVRGLKAADDLGDPDIEELESYAPAQAAILQALAESKDPVRQAELLKRLGKSSSPVKALVDKGLAEKVDIRVRREPFKTRGTEERPAFTPTRGQSDALRIISDSRSTQATTLLYGVTGSGKTEVYLRSIEEVLADGGSAISLVPEISLTAHLMDAYRARFGDRMAILHSRLSIGERHDEWRRIESGEARVVLGARSAVFAPIHELGMVIIDEEHEPSYKQDRSPRYNARTAAEERAGSAGATVILGSATPSMETFYRSSCGDINLAVLDKRIDDRPMPSVEVVDLRDEFEHGRRNVFSQRLQEAIAERLARKEQTILFVNRRGYASFVLCRTCGYTAKCENCDVSLTFHASSRMLRCHHCDETQVAPTICPKCGGPHIRQFGIGTEKVEEETRRLFPDANVIRMDADTTARKNAHLKLLDTFREGRADILIGTQMVAKGLDFPNVTLVGAISADTILHLPDFRASERTFQLLTQVSGRAGRGQLPGEVVVQSFSPDHYAIRAAARQDFLSFYGQEITCRRELRYPPFARLINIVCSDPVDGYPSEKLSQLADQLRNAVPRDAVEVIGPAPAPLAKLRGLYRWHLLLRDRGGLCDGELQSILLQIIDGMPSDFRTGLTIDVDPLSML